MTLLFRTVAAAIVAFGVVSTAGAAELTGSATVTLPDELLDTWRVPLDALQQRLDALEDRVDALEATPAPNPDPDPDPEPTTCGPATGRFVVAGSKVCGPDGNQFTYKGVNVWPGQAGQTHRDAIARWGFNAVEINWARQSNWTVTVATVQGAIDAYTSRGYVVTVEWMGVAPGSTPSTADRNRAAADMAEIAALNVGNPRVWLVTANELMSPSTAQTYDAAGNPTGWVPERAAIWIDFNRTVAQAIRDTGFTGPIVMNGMLWGSDRARKSNNQQYWAGSYPLMSSLLTFWPQLSAGFDNVIPGMHSYWFYQAPSQAEVDAYFDAFDAAGLPLIIGEFGEDHTSSPNSGKELTGVVNVTRLVAAWLSGRGVGGAAWHLDHNGGSGGRHNLVGSNQNGPDANADFSNVSPYGAKVREWLTAP